MAKDKSLSKEERKAAKKAAKVEADGISKSKSDKKEKKEKKAKKEALAIHALSAIEKTNGIGKDGEVVSDDDDEQVSKIKTTRPIGALVPFANPLADDKVGKKVFKGVKKAAAQRTLKRGVKEVVKALRKSPTTNPPSAGDALPGGIVVLAADISPMDVISHIPVLCEDHNIPYIYVTSRAELGMAGQTKRPTSVVMVSKDIVAKKGADKNKKDAAAAASDDDWADTYKSLVKTIEREGKHVKI